MNRITDTGRVAAAFHQNAAGYDQHTLVQKRVVKQLLASVGHHPGQSPARILDVGTGTGALLEHLALLYPQASLAGIDIALNMCLNARLKLGNRCRFVTGTAECLPFRSAAFDLVVSASVLQWVADLSAALTEMQRVVKPGGDINLAFFCEGTLEELQYCFKEADGLVGGHNASRLHRFRSVDEVRSIAESMDFDRVVIHVETEVDWYDDLYALLRAIKNIGAGAVSGGSGGLGWRGFLRDVSQRYEKKYGRNGKIPATYTVLYLTARRRE